MANHTRAMRATSSAARTDRRRPTLTRGRSSVTLVPPAPPPLPTPLLLMALTAVLASTVAVPTPLPVRVAEAFLPPPFGRRSRRQRRWGLSGPLTAAANDEPADPENRATAASPVPEGPSRQQTPDEKKKVVIIGAGWGGLSAAHALSSQTEVPLEVSVVDASPTVGGLVRDGFRTINGTIGAGGVAEAGQHGFWDNYRNIFALLDGGSGIPGVDCESVLTGYAEQGQYSPDGLEAVWPVYREKVPQLPTGLAQALYTRFTNLPFIDRASALPLALAFSEFDDSPEAWAKYDSVSFRDLCVKLGVSRRCYDEAFEPMILTGLFAPGAECSAAAALGMAYFFVLKSQNSFDVRWCRGNIGDKIFRPWVEHMKHDQEGRQAVRFLASTRVVGFEKADDGNKISRVLCETTPAASGGSAERTTTVIESDVVIFAVGGAALNNLVRSSPDVLASHAEFRRFANLRGTGVLATRLFLDRTVAIPYSANACWGFDEGVGMTFFDITKLHGLRGGEGGSGDGTPPGSVVEVDYYHAASLLVMDDASIVDKVKADLDVILGGDCKAAEVLDAAVVKLPSAVNWYSPGSYASMPDAASKAIPNAYFAGDLVRSRHGSWSQEKAFVSGIEAANAILGRRSDHGIIPLDPDEWHVALGRGVSSAARTVLGGGDPSRGPSLVDFLW